MKAYRIAEVHHMGFEDNPYYAASLAKARAEMARRLLGFRKSDEIDKHRKREYGTPTFTFNRGKAAHDNAILSVTYWEWSSWSTEWGQEADVYPQELCLWEIEIEE